MICTNKMSHNLPVNVYICVCLETVFPFLKKAKRSLSHKKGSETSVMLLLLKLCVVTRVISNCFVEIKAQK